jgi:hypothetical protein
VTTAINQPPPAWGNDELSNYLDTAHQNQYATFAKKREVMDKLVAIDAQFAKVTTGWLNPKSEIVALLFIRCHGAYRTACGLAMSGQAAECYVQCRSVLEYAGYAVHINRNPSFEKVWFDRHQNQVGMKASRDSFQHGVVLVSVRAANRHAAERFETTYQRMIDLGGHPNVRAVTTNTKMKKGEEPDSRETLAILLHEDGMPLDMALRTAAQCGMIALELFETIYGAKFEVLGIKAAMLDLRPGL